MASQHAQLDIIEPMALHYLRDSVPLRAGQPGERLGLTSGSITPLVDRLEKESIGFRSARASTAADAGLAEVIGERDRDSMGQALWRRWDMACTSPRNVNCHIATMSQS
ncbi:MAG: hypothetical protein NVS4B2_18010 [Chloroflexota bacterium]